jgi:hypothetical protein
VFENERRSAKKTSATPFLARLKAKNEIALVPKV